MYKTKKYQKEDKDYIFDFINHHPFATFIINGNSLLATHIPVLTKGNSEDFLLYGHIADTNEQYDFLKDEVEGLLIFKGPDAYVSSSWYSEKNISTWDYAAVHVNVKIKIQSDEELEESLKDLVFHFEKDQENPEFYEEIPKQMLKDHLPHIMGFWCRPVKIEAIAKLHQGYKKGDVQNVIHELERSGDPEAKNLSENIRREHGL